MNISCDRCEKLVRLQEVRISAKELEIHFICLTCKGVTVYTFHRVPVENVYELASRRDTALR